MDRNETGVKAMMGLSGDVYTSTRRNPVRSLRSSRRRTMPLALVALTSIVILAFAISPVDESSAAPSREVDCLGCHDQIVETLLTVTGVPLEYTPGAVYTITIQVNDLNGENGENGFYMVSDGGVFSNPGANAEVNSATTASTIDARPRPESSWTVEWTAPASGTVNILVYAVSATDDLTGNSAPSDDDVVTASPSAAIPEFTILLLPIAGAMALILGVARLTRKGRQ